jgi:hypothetical protein
MINSFEVWGGVELTKIYAIYRTDAESADIALEVA